MGYLKLFRFLSVMMVQTKCKLNTELFPQTVSYSVQRNTTKKQQNLKNGIVRFRLNNDVRKAECHRMPSVKTDYVRKRSTEF